MENLVDIVGGLFMGISAQDTIYIFPWPHLARIGCVYESLIEERRGGEARASALPHHPRIQMIGKIFSTRISDYQYRQRCSLSPIGYQVFLATWPRPYDGCSGIGNTIHRSPLLRLCCSSTLNTKRSLFQKPRFDNYRCSADRQTEVLLNTN